MSCVGEVLRAPANVRKSLARSIAAPELGATGAAPSDVSLGIVCAAGGTLESLIERVARIRRR
jgi:hypothetical protein